MDRGKQTPKTHCPADDITHFQEEKILWGLGHKGKISHGKQNRITTNL